MLLKTAQNCFFFVPKTAQNCSENSKKLLFGKEFQKKLLFGIEFQKKKLLKTAFFRFKNCSKLLSELPKTAFFIRFEQFSSQIGAVLSSFPKKYMPVSSFQNNSEQF